MTRTTRHPARWLLLAIAAPTAIAGIDIVIGGPALLVGVLVTGPLIASLRLPSRLVALVGAYALFLAVLVGVVDGKFGTLDHTTRSITVVVGGLLAYVIARVREGRERATGALEAQHAVARILAEAHSLAEATPQVMPEIARTLGWDAGALWEIDRFRDRLVPAQTWSSHEHELDEFLAATRGKRLARGDLLPGVVWERSEAAWITDIGHEEAFSRREAALDAGVATVAGFPIEGPDGARGVIELYSTRRSPPDHEMLEMMAGFGRQLGEFIERRSVDEAVRRSDAMRGAILRGALDAVITMDHTGRITEFNPAAERIFGHPRGDAVGSDLADLIIPPDLREAHRAGLKRFLATNEGTVIDRRLELTGMRKGGAIFPAELTVSLIEETEPPAFSGQVRDITDRKQYEDDLRRSRDQLEVILQGVADGVTAQEPNGRLVYANDAAVRVLGFDDPADLLGASNDEIMARFEVMNEHGRPFPVEDLPGRRALLGNEPPDVTLRFRVRATGEERWSVVKARPITGIDGRVLMAINIFEDVTEQKRREESQRFLAEASKLLSASLDYETTLRRVASLTVPQIADWAVIDVLDDDGRLRPVALEHQDPEMIKKAQFLREKYPPQPGADRGADQVVKTGEPQLWPEIPDELLRETMQSDEQYRLIKELKMRSVMIVPIEGPEGMVGTMSFISSQRRYEDGDLRLARDLAQRAGLAIANARLYSERAHIARTLQESLLPPRLPAIPGIETAARFRAAGSGNEVGGDFYDLFELGDQNWAVVIGDVCGKGPEAAAITALARYTLRAAAMQTERPSMALEILNEAMLAQRSDKRFASVAFTSLSGGSNGRTGHLSACVSSGGHPLPLVLRADGTVERAGRYGTLIGIVPDPDLQDQSLDLESGDSLVLFTDGVIEVRRDEQEIFGEPELEALAATLKGQSATQIADRIESDVVEAWGGQPKDDIAIVVLQVS